VYTGTFRNTSITTGAGTLGTTLTVRVPQFDAQEFLPLFLTHTSGDDIHGDEQFLAIDYSDGTHWLLVSKGATVSWTVAASSADIAFYYEARDGPDKRVVISGSAMPNGNYSFVAPYTAFYRLLISSAGTLSYSTAVQISAFVVTNPTTNGAWCQNSVQDVSDQFDELDSFRVHGSSILLTQASSVTNMNGRVLQMQVPAGCDTLYTLRKSFQDFAHSNTKMFQPRDLYEGAYSYTRIADKIKDLSLRSEWEVDADGVLAAAYWPIVSESPMLVFYLYVPVAAGRVFTFQPGLSISADGDSQWKDLQEATGDDDCIEDVLFVCRGVPQHMENETHESFISQLADLGAMAAPFLGPTYGPAVMAASGVAKMLGSASGSSVARRRAPKGFNGKQ
jgi:hypothetical protein